MSFQAREFQFSIVPERNHLVSHQIEFTLRLLETGYAQ